MLLRQYLVYLVYFSAFASAEVKYHQPPLPFTNKNVLYVLSLRRNWHDPHIPPPLRLHNNSKPWPSLPPTAFATTSSIPPPPSFVSITLVAFPTVPIAQRLIKYAQIHPFRADQTGIAATLRKNNKQNKRIHATDLYRHDFLRRRIQAGHPQYSRLR